MYQEVVQSLNPPWIEQKVLEIRENSSCMYGFDYPNLSRNVIVEMKFVGPLRSDFDDDRISIDLKRPSLNQEFRKHNPETGKGYSMKIHLETVGPKIILKFQEKSDDFEEEIE